MSKVLWELSVQFHKVQKKFDPKSLHDSGFDWNANVSTVRGFEVFLEKFLWHSKELEFILTPWTQLKVRILDVYTHINLYVYFIFQFNLHIIHYIVCYNNNDSVVVVHLLKLALHVDSPKEPMMFVNKSWINWLWRVSQSNYMYYLGKGNQFRSSK